ncbi:MAG: hypothetical protein H7Z17_02725 [Fuerstia sp.]|nr:hypothetical protein [Fuerstiella sp.]
MNLPPGAFRYLLIGQAIIPFFINIAVNVILGALKFWGQESVATWAIDKGAAADSIGTCFFLPFITCLIATPIVRHQVAHGAASRIPPTDTPHWARMMSGQVILRAAKFGVAGIVLLAGPVYAVYSLLAGDSIETVRFITIKALFAGVYGIFATPLIAFVAMCDQSASPQPR